MNSKEFIRFIALENSRDDPWLATGVVTMTQDLINRKLLSKSDLKVARQIFNWLNQKVPCPPFKKNLNKNWTCDAVCWFTAKAAMPIKQMRPLTRICRDYGLTVRVLKSKDPGKIVYRDLFQIVAETPDWRKNLFNSTS